jgi:hypothetical protein
MPWIRKYQNVIGSRSCSVWENLFTSKLCVFIWEVVFMIHVLVIHSGFVYFIMWVLYNNKKLRKKYMILKLGSELLKLSCTWKPHRTGFISFKVTQCLWPWRPILTPLALPFWVDPLFNPRIILLQEQRNSITKVKKRSVFNFPWGRSYISIYWE